MDTAVKTSGRAVAAFALGLLSLACGFLALVRCQDLFLLVILVSLFPALVLGVGGLRQIRRAPGRLRGKSLAAWGIGLPVGSLVLGVVLLPVT